MLDRKILKLSNREIKKVNEECDLGVDFDDTFVAVNHTSSIVSRAKGMIALMVRNIISIEANIALEYIKPNKTSHWILCSALGSCISPWKF